MASTKISDRDVSTMSQEELDAEAADLAALRTAVRLRQNAVQAQSDLNAALAAMPAEARRIVMLRLDGTAAPDGVAAAKE